MAGPSILMTVGNVHARNYIRRYGGIDLYPIEHPDTPDELLMEIRSGMFRVVAFGLHRVRRPEKLERMARAIVKKSNGISVIVGVSHVLENSNLLRIEFFEHGRGEPTLLDQQEVISDGFLDYMIHHARMVEYRLIHEAPVPMH